MKKILAVYDADDEYGRRLSEYLNRKESVPFTMAFFTKEEALLEYGREHPIDMLLISENAVNENIAALNIKRIVYLTEIQGKVSRPENRFVYKFQSSDHVIRELISCYEAVDMDVAKTIASLKPVTMVGIYSPISRCLKTSFALTLGQVLSRNQLVLYLNFEDFSGLEALFCRVFSSDLSDAVFYYTQGQLKNQIEGLTESWHNMDYLPPVRYPEDLYDADTDTVVGMIKEIASACHYDVLLLDFGCSIRFASRLLPECGKIYMPILDDPVSAGKLESFESWMKMKNQTDLLARITKLKLPYYRGFGNGEMYLEQLLWGELGDYVRTLVKGEW